MCCNYYYVYFINTTSSFDTDIVVDFGNGIIISIGISNGVSTDTDNINFICSRFGTDITIDIG